MYDRAARRAGVLGLAGTVIGIALFFHDLPDTAARAHVTSMQALHGDTLLVLIMLICAVVGFALAAAGTRAGWFSRSSG